MSEEDRVFVEHILESIRLIEEYTKRLSREDFFASLQLQDAVIRRLEIIGGAVKNLSFDLKEDHPDVPWRQIAGMRDVLVHEYFGVDLELVWETVQEDLPFLRRRLSDLLAGNG